MDSLKSTQQKDNPCIGFETPPRTTIHESTELLSPPDCFELGLRCGSAVLPNQRKFTLMKRNLIGVTPVDKTKHPALY